MCKKRGIVPVHEHEAGLFHCRILRIAVVCCSETYSLPIQSTRIQWHIPHANSRALKILVAIASKELIT